jgi:hypothetical protein
MKQVRSESEDSMKMLLTLALLAGFGLVSVSGAVQSTVGKTEGEGPSLPRQEWRRGLAIAPVPLDLEGKNRKLVGEGSYIVNAQSACADCHSCPTYTPGHNPFEGGDGQINPTNYLAGGVSFGPVVSANITPDENGLPHGLTRAEFIEIIRTGHDEGEILQVMPWPIFRNMTDHDLEAIYEYLTAIPHAEPGECAGPGQ